MILRTLAVATVENLMGNAVEERHAVNTDCGTRKVDHNDAGCRRSLAVEPMTCAPNAFSTGDALVRLHPGERFAAACGISPC